MLRVIVNRNIITHNANTGSDDPPFSILRPGKHAETAREIGLKGNVKLVYKPHKPLSNGARVWLEADDAEVLVA